MKYALFQIAEEKLIDSFQEPDSFFATKSFRLETGTC
jgi:hypothetical protein